MANDKDAMVRELVAERLKAGTVAATAPQDLTASDTHMT